MKSISWKELAKLVAKGHLEWQILLGGVVENKKLGAGVIERIEGLYFYVAYEDGVKCHSFAYPLESYFFSPQLPDNVAEYIEGLKQKVEEKHRRQQKARSKLESAFKTIIDPYGRLSQQALSDHIDAQLPHPELDMRDIQLSLEWSRSDELKSDINPAESQTIARGKYQKNPELGRVLSARAAEKAAITFFRWHSFTVEDISVKQVIDPLNSEWATYDLIVNGFPVDVKNARRSAQNRDSYVEYCVPRFKQDRHNEDVSIAGVLSNYLWPCHILMPKDAQCDTAILMLGTTTWRRILSLKTEFERPNFLQIDVSPSSNVIQFLPPWLFEFESSLYQRRDKAIDQAKQLPMPGSKLWRIWQKRRDYSTFANKQLLPILIAARRDFEEHWEKELLQDWEWDFILTVRSQIDRVGLSLPFLFCSILSHFLKMVASEEAGSGYTPSQYRRLLFFDGAHLDRPLFIFDPLKTIDSLIKTLTILWDAEKTSIRAFRMFRLSGLNILQGRTGAESDDHWKTLVAYCGGRIEGKGKCGYAPLVLGSVPHCPKCGKLICPKCGFCSQKCQPAQSDRLTSSENDGVSDWYDLPF